MTTINGESQVVDFDKRTLNPGIYALLDCREGRRVDHVRMIAQARTDDAVLRLLLER
jgi:hypothetical protein